MNSAYVWDSSFMPSIENENIIGTPSRPGIEADLVMSFVKTSLPAEEPGETKTVFIEPKIGTLRPDIVVIYWNPDITSKWPEERQHLNLFDLQTIQALLLSGPCTLSELSQFMPLSKLKRSLEKLSRANCVQSFHSEWFINDLSSVFAVRSVIAFEAKLSNTHKAIEQAYANTWFSSESYILMPSKQPRSDTLEKAQHYGVGIWSYKDQVASQIMTAEKHTLPFSYGTWIFNEMVWNYSKGRVYES